MQRCGNCFCRMWVACLTVEQSDDRACWSITVLISCWLVWRDVVLPYFRKYFSGETAESQTASGRTTIPSGNFISDEAQPEKDYNHWTEETAVDSRPVFESAIPAGNINSDRAHLEELFEDPLCARLQSPTGDQTPSARLRSPDSRTSGRLRMGD